MTPQITTEIVEVLRQCEVDLTEAGNIITGTGLRATGGLMHASAERLRALLSRLEAKGRGKEARDERLALERDLDAVNSELAGSKAALAASDKRVAELEAEVARKDEALRAIDQRRYADRSTVTPDNAFAAFGKLNSAVIEIYDIARAALAPRNETGGKEEKAT